MNDLRVPGIVLGTLLLLANIQGVPINSSCCQLSLPLPNISLIAGGQNGTWFKADQDPRLFKVNLTTVESDKLPTFNSQGTIWSGSTNGTNWLISGWGNDRYDANPPIIIYDSSFHIISRSNEPDSHSSWYGGDIFASSHGAYGWLLSGLGSGYLGGISGNHMSLALFNGSNFTDLSSSVPRNQLGILFANQWNGSLWMVGGGFRLKGLLFTFNGTSIHDLTGQVSDAMQILGPVTSLGWNGTDWLIGGYESLAIYNGHKFVDLTALLASVVGKQFHAVNAISWDKLDNMWLLAGGYPKADLRPGTAWAAALSSSGQAKNLSSLISPYLTSANSSSILTATFNNGLWAVGGYKTKGKQVTPILLIISLPANTVTDISRTVDDTTYVIWIQFNPLTQHPVTQPRPRCDLTNEPRGFSRCAGDEVLISSHANVVALSSLTSHWIASIAQCLSRKIPVFG